MKGILECTHWMMENPLKNLITVDGDRIAYFEADRFLEGVSDNPIVVIIGDFSLFYVNEWIPEIEKKEMQAKLEADRIAKLSPEDGLYEYISNYADDFKYGSYVKTDELYEGIMEHLSKSHVELIKAYDLKILNEKAWMYDQLEK